MRCQCDRLDDWDTGDECQRTLGRRHYRVTVVPIHDRGSAEASGAYTYYGGVESVAVCDACMRGWLREHLADDDPRFVRISRAASATDVPPL